MMKPYLSNIYLFKVSYKKTRKRGKIRLKLVIKAPERCHWCHWCRSSVFIVNLEDISDLFKLFMLLLWMLVEITLFTYLLAFNPFHVKLFSGGIETVCQQSLIEMYPNKNKEFFWSVFSCSGTEYGDLLCIQSDYRKIRTRKNSVFRHVSRSEYWCKMG